MALLTGSFQVFERVEMVMEPLFLLLWLLALPFSQFEVKLKHGRDRVYVLGKPDLLFIHLARSKEPLPRWIRTTTFLHFFHPAIDEDRVGISHIAKMSTSDVTLCPFNTTKNSSPRWTA